MKLIIFLIGILTFNTLSGQMFQNESGDILSENPFFNAKFIRSAGLKHLSGEVSTKKELGTIRNSNKTKGYLFDESGNLTAQYSTLFNGQKRDTNFIFYEYDEQARLLVKRFSDSYGFYSYTYEYNIDGQKTKQIYAREKNASRSKINFSLAEQYVIFEESYTYSKKDSTIKKIILNSNGRPYQEETKQYNFLGYLAQENTRLLINNTSKSKKYEYNHKGFLKLIDYYKVPHTVPYKSIKYAYDEWGNVTFVDEYKDQQRVKHVELLYDPSTLILKTILSQDLVTNLITITKLKPEFYN